jgi:uncharacterized protein (DUF1501 family)
MTSGQARFPIAPSKYQFKQHGKSGMWVSELLPETAKVVDDMCFIRSMHTEAINHEPAITAMQTGNMVTGRPCLGSWLSYGLGSMNADLPTFVVMVARATNNDQNQAISGRLWSSGFLDGKHAGVTFRAAEDPILFLRNPSGVSSKVRRASLDSLNQLNAMNLEMIGDPEIRTRIEQYELAFRMQSSVPELTETKSEPKSVTDLYGPEVHKAGSLAHSMLLARRMTERGVRFVQIYHNNWDHHANLTGRMKFQCGDLDRPTFGLLTDLRQRGMLDDTLVIWGGEFGRTPTSDNNDVAKKKGIGRDHNAGGFTMWMAGGGSKGGHIHGETDDFSYNITRDPVHVRDLHASVLHLLGFDHERFTVRSQGLDQRLTGVEPAKVIKELLA